MIVESKPKVTKTDVLQKIKQILSGHDPENVKEIVIEKILTALKKAKVVIFTDEELKENNIKKPSEY